jgi:hypothetical protein
MYKQNKSRWAMAQEAHLLAQLLVRSFARKTRVRKITHEKVSTLNLALLYIAIYRHVVSNVLEKACTHTMPLDIGFASDV